MGGCLSRRSLEHETASPRCTRGGALPLDVMSEVLLRLPAKTLCRLRAVCRQWRSLLSDPQFIAAHSARHPGPLIFSLPCDDSGIFFDITDLSGNVVKRVLRTVGEIERVISTHLGLVCIVNATRGVHQVLNPVTGAVVDLPSQVAKEHEAQVRGSMNHYTIFITLGQVASTGFYKVLRVIYRDSDGHPNQLCEVLTLGGSNYAQWRGKQGPPGPIAYFGCWRTVVINGVVYFYLKDQDGVPDRIASFDLETEEWKETMRGPSLADNAAGIRSSKSLYESCLMMCTLNGHLAVAHRMVTPVCSMDLWFLMDFEKKLWVKQYSLNLQFGGSACPLSVLNDGRIVADLCAGNGSVLRIYSPGTNSFTDLRHLGYHYVFGLYTGNLLSLVHGVL